MATVIVCATLLLGMGAVFAAQLLTALNRFRIKKMYTAAMHAPSVSVCIPARNETHAMTQCLEHVLSSDYRKLEVIVYDDSSIDDTSFLIRSFAHAGVRFVPGTPLPEGWLGKNHALEVLALEASGTYLLFLDVDTLVQPTTISQLVGYMMTEEVKMASVIPRRNDLWRRSVLFGVLRYFWQLILTRRNHPAASSAAWLIERETLLGELGGFAALKMDVQPEATIAARLGTAGYHCLVSNESLGVSFEKRWSSQVETSRRLLFPMMGGKWWGGMLGLAGLVLLNLPLLAMFSTPLFGWTTVHMLALSIIVLYMIIYGLFTHFMWRRGWWLGALLWPFAVLQELILFVWSLIGYARHTVTWKGRLVTIGNDDEATTPNA